MGIRKNKGFVRTDLIGKVMGIGLFWYFLAGFLSKQNPGGHVFESIPFSVITFLYLFSMVITVVLAIIGDQLSWGSSRRSPTSQFVPCIVFATILAWWLAGDMISSILLLIGGVLLCTGYRFNYRRQFGLINAIAKSDQTLIEHLLKKPGQMNVRAGRHGPMHTAIETDDFEVANKLLAAGAEINRPGYYGITALGYTLSGKIESMRYLLEKGADPNLLLPNGETYLMALVYHSQKQDRDYQAILDDVLAKTQLLLDAGADSTRTNKNGASAVDIAIERKLSDLART
jgi:hypothetical protein